MRASGEIAKHLVQRIGHVFKRPFMYGGDSAGVDLILHEYIALWAYVVDRESDFERAKHNELQRRNYGSANFATRYLMDHPTATAEETAAAVIRSWQSIAQAIGAPA